MYKTKPLALSLLLIFLSCLSFHNTKAFTDAQLTVGKLESFHSDLFSADKIELAFSFLDTNSIKLHFRAENIQAPYLATLESVTFDCDLSSKSQQNTICQNGTLILGKPFSQTHGNINLALQTSPEISTTTFTNLQLFSGYQLFEFVKKDNQLSISFDIDNMKISELMDLFQENIPALEEYSFTKGYINLAGNIKFTDGNLQLTKIDSNIHELFVDGEQVMENVTLNSQIDIERLKHGYKFHHQISFVSGAMYLVPGFDVFEQKPGFYLELDKQDINGSISGQISSDLNNLIISRFDYTHGNLLNAIGLAEIDFLSGSIFKNIEIDVSANDLKQIYPVYIEPILLATDYSELETSGSMQIKLSHVDHKLDFLNLFLNDLYIDDKRNRFSVANLNSNIIMENSTDLKVSTITWDSVSVYRLLFGSADMEMESSKNDYTVSKWQDINLLDGSLSIRTLTLENVGEPDFKLTLDGNLKPITIATFSQVMGWPAMSGTLAGELTGLEYQNNHLQIHGDIDFEIFNGHITLSNMDIENLFSSYSRLKTNIIIDGLDLETLTDTFTFGKIQGTLNGYMYNLILENWQPVAFNAKFETPVHDDRPHRISQKALENLSEIGGGISKVLSNTLLKFIPEYSYGRLGLSCRLENGVCNLGGVEETDDGFYILTRGGLLPPWVDVKGTGRSIYWDNLIDGLKQINEGDIEFK